MNYRMKKIAKLLGVSVLSLSLCACNGATPATSENSVSDTQASEAGELLTYEELDKSEMFSDRDKEIGYDEDSASQIDITNETSLSITKAGTYVLSGTMTNGQVVIDANDAKIWLVLNGVDITNESSAAIYVKNADKVFVTLADGSSNNLATTNEFVAIDDNNIDAVIFSKDDITFNGNGTLTVTTEHGNGITSKNDLKITSGNYTIKTSGHGLEGKDSVRIAEGNVTIDAGKDGVHSENSDEADKGYVYISGGNLNITSAGDGIDASGIVQLDGGDYSIVSGGGHENAAAHTNDMPGGGAGFKGPGERPKDGNMPQPGEQPSDGNMPQPGEQPKDGNMPQPSEQPSDANIVQQEQLNEMAAVSTEVTEATETTETTSTKAIKSDKMIFANSGSYTIDSADDSFHSGGDIQIADGEYKIITGDDGFHADNSLVVNGGSIVIEDCYEGIEGLTITLNNGDISVNSSDDGLNAAGGNDQSGFGGGFNRDSFGKNEGETTEASSDSWIIINSGTLYVNANGDGIDSNGNLTINGGEITVDGPANGGNSAIDYGDFAKAYINGGTVIAIGCTGMVESFDESSTQPMMNVQVSDSNITGDISLCDSKGNVIASYSPKKQYNCVQISSASLEVGETYTLTAGDTTTTIEMSQTLFSNITGNRTTRNFG